MGLPKECLALNIIRDENEVKKAFDKLSYNGNEKSSTNFFVL